MRRRDAYLGQPAALRVGGIVQPALHLGYLARIALLDGNLHAVAQLPVDGAGGQGDVERHLIIVRSQRFQVSADLVADITVTGGAVGTDNADIHQPLLHQVAAGIVHHQRVRDACFGQLPRGKVSALIARSGLVDPHMHINTGRLRVVDGGADRAPIHCGQPAGVTVGENIDWTAVLRMQVAQQSQAMLAQLSIGLRIFIADALGLLARAQCARLPLRYVRQCSTHALHCPAQVYRGGAGVHQLLPCLVQHLRTGLAVGCLSRHQIQGPGGGGADERCAAYQHVRDSVNALVQGSDRGDEELVGQPALINNLHRVGRLWIQPDGAIVFAVNVHVLAFSG